MDLMPVGGNEWILATNVIDTGSGIDKKRLPFLFKTFGELRNKLSLKEVKDNGIGIGLTCSKTIAKFLGGDIEISSVPGHTDV